MRKILIPTLFLLVACSPLRHYNKVVNDPFRNAKERALLARASQQEFPNVVGDTAQTITYDSSQLQRLNEEYNALVDELVKHYDHDDSSQKVNKVFDTIWYEKIRSLKPATITKTITKEVKVRDGVWAEVKQNEINTCREELRLMTFQKDEFKTKRDNIQKILWYMGGAILAMLALIIWKPRIPKLF